MLSTKTSSHIRNMRNVKSFRSGHMSTSVSMSHADKEIMSSETERLLQRNERRRWLIHQWKEHVPNTRNSSPQRRKERKGSIS